MASCWTHATAAARRWGGEPEDYLAVHMWFDEPKNHVGDFRHRMLRHHTLGIAEALARFGESLTLSTGRTIPMRWVVEQHMIEDFGRIPSVQDWLTHLAPQPWMASAARRLSAELEGATSGP